MVSLVANAGGIDHVSNLGVIFYWVFADEVNIVNQPFAYMIVRMLKKLPLLSSILPIELIN